MLVDSNLLLELDRNAFSPRGQPMTIYGDPAYALWVRRKHPYCSKDLGNSLPNSASTKLHFIVFYKKVVLVYASKLRLNVFDIDGDPSMQHLVQDYLCWTLLARCLVVIHKQHPCVCGPTEDSLFKALH